MPAGGPLLWLFDAGPLAECCGGVKVCHPPIEGLLGFAVVEFCGELPPRFVPPFAALEPKECQPGCDFDCGVVGAPPRPEFAAPVARLPELLKVRAPLFEPNGAREELLEALKELCAFAEVTNRCELDGACE